MSETSSSSSGAAEAAPTAAGETASATPSSSASTAAAADPPAPTSTPSLVVPRSSVEFFAAAAPKLHAYVRDIQRENESLRAQNEQLRSDASILDSISDFLREMSKTDMNYKQFMEFKTKEVEDAKKAKAAAAGGSTRTNETNAESKPKTELPPVKAPPVKETLASSSSSSSSAAPASTLSSTSSSSSSTATTTTAASSTSSGGNMFAGIKGGFFNKPSATKAVAPAVPDVTVPPPSTPSAPTTAAGATTAAPGVDFTIQPCLSHHVPQIAAIYAHWVKVGTGTFEEESPSVEEMTRRRDDLLSKNYPYIVATRPSATESSGEQVVGYAYAGPFRLRSAYRFTVEDSIYIHPDYTNNKRSQESASPSPSNRSGLGHALLTELIRLCRTAGYRHMLSLIGDSQNNASIRLHEKLGFSHSGNMKEVGFKFQRWLDVVIMQLELNTSVKGGESNSIIPPNPQHPVYHRIEYQDGRLSKHEAYI